MSPSSSVDTRIRARFTSLDRATKRALLLALDCAFVPLAMFCALGLQAGSLVPDSKWIGPIVASVLVSVPVFARVGLYRAVTRYVGPHAVAAIAVAVLISLAALSALAFAGLLPGLRISSLLIYGNLSLLYVGATRLTLRWLLGRGNGAPVVIYGAGDAGAALAAALNAVRGQFVPVAFVDDDVALHGSVIAGIRVHSPARLGDLISRHGIRRVLLAMPRLSLRRRREILHDLQALSVHVQTIPSIASLVNGTARVHDVQDVDAADLLGRDAVPPNQQLLDGCIRGKNVLVTGAGGSIGSELCRQILKSGPRRLLLLEMSELALYTVERELRQLIERGGLETQLVPLLGNAHHKYRVREILQTFEVQTIYHAAAYKHVPIVEHNMIEGLHNNVIATWHTAEAALECRVESFVLVSTDKAVNPTNVMGATKRFAEIVLQGVQQRTSTTRFCVVRFGNVLESSGSVVPLFREQILRGGPVTVTHPDVIRYFMTIPEAAQLVIQAGSMARGGDVFVLDMGKPVRIADLARRMVQLSGLTVRDEQSPDGDIEIRFTGLRPAEKLYEELLIGQNVTGTDHSMIMRAVEHALPWEEVQTLLDELSISMRRFDCRAAREILQRTVAEYRPSIGIEDLVWVSRQASAPAAEGKITDLAARRGRAPPG